MIPPFDNTGNLPPGIHWATWEEFVQRFGVNEHRRMLIRGLEAALISLHTASCHVAYIDGSFVSSEELPNDYDGCWETTGVDFNLVDPVLLTFTDGRRVQKTKYMGELFPARISDGTTGLIFLDFFQTDKENGNPKGIVALDLRSLT